MFLVGRRHGIGSGNPRQRPSPKPRPLFQVPQHQSNDRLGSLRGNIHRLAFRHAARLLAVRAKPTGVYPNTWPGDFEPSRKCWYNNWLEHGTPSTSDWARVAQWLPGWPNGPLTNWGPAPNRRKERPADRPGHEVLPKKRWF